MTVRKNKPDSSIKRSPRTLYTCKGYEPDFIDGMKIINSNLLNEPDLQLLPKIDGKEKGPLHYTNLSVYLNTKRKMAFYSVYNIDGSTKGSVIRDLDFIPDPRILESEQLGDAFYDLKKGEEDFDKGHLAANNEMAWNPTAQTKAYQTFFHANACPQVSILNKGLWKTLETYFINESSTAVNSKINVFSGPILKNSDPKYLVNPSYKLPLHFFKIVVFKFAKKFYSTGFVFSQRKALIELELIESDKFIEEAYRPFENFNYKEIFQVDVNLISNETGIIFEWPGVEPLKISDGMKKLKAIDKIKNTAQAKEKIKELKKTEMITESFFPRANKLEFVYPA